MCKLRRSAPGVDDQRILRSEAPVVFKIGITCTPFVRWRAYEREGYQQMHLLHVTEEPGLVQMMEAAPGILNRSVRKEDLVAKACHWQNSQFVLCIVLVHDMQNWFVFCCLSSGKSNKGPKAALCQITQALISEFQGRPGCRNVAKGGEGRTGGMSTVSLYEFVKGPCFVLQG